MNTGTCAMALTVLAERSIRDAARALEKPVSSVADAFERFETWLALKLATRGRDGLTLTLTGEALRLSTGGICDHLVALARLCGHEESDPKSALAHVAARPVSLAMIGNFLTVMRVSSIRRAASLLKIPQPALSRQMARLETILQAPLFTRNRAGCIPTEKGMALFTLATDLIAALSVLSGQADQRFAEGLRTVRLGTIIPFGHESLLAARLARLVADWHRSGDGQRLLVSSTPAEDLLEGLASGTLDLALSDMAVYDRRFESREVFRSQLVLVGPADLATADHTLASALSRYDLVVPSLRSGLRQAITAILEQMPEKIARSAMVEVDTLSIIINLVLHHGFVTILPLDAAEAIRDSLAVIPLPKANTLPFHMVWLKGPRSRRHAERVAEILTRFPVSGKNLP